MIPNEDSLRDQYDRLANRPLDRDTRDWVESIERNQEEIRRQKAEDLDNFMEKLFGVR